MIPREQNALKIIKGFLLHPGDLWLLVPSKQLMETAVSLSKAIINNQCYYTPLIQWLPFSPGFICHAMIGSINQKYVKEKPKFRQPKFNLKEGWVKSIWISFGCLY